MLSAVLSLGFLLLALWSRPKNPSVSKPRSMLLLHFALIGLGFMLLEIGLLKRLELLLGQPVLSVVVTLSTLLMAGGLGSFFVRGLDVKWLTRTIRLAAFAITCYAILLVIFLPGFTVAVLPLDLWNRCLVTVLLVSPLGVLLGVPFPAGLRLATHSDNQGIALYWAANSLTSTLGAVLASVLGVVFSFQVSILVAGMLYFSVAVGFHLQTSVVNSSKSSQTPYTTEGD